MAVFVREWLQPLARPFARAFDHDRAALVQELVESGLPHVRRTLQQKAPPPSVIVTDGASLVVAADGVPLMKGDRDDKALVDAWKFLANPLPLANGPSPAILETVLRLEFPWLEEVIDAVMGDLRLRLSMGQQWFRFRPTLVSGPPGTGKTTFARRLGQLIGTGYGEMSAAGSSDNRLLAGTARGWSTAQPSYVLQVVRQAKVANPLILIDEIDKTRPDGRNGDIRATLLAMLEPTTSRRWLDECLCVPVDLGAVSWILTANDTDGLRGPLLTRMRVVNVPPPGAEHIDAILLGVRRDLAREFGVDERDVPDLPEYLESEIRRACRAGISLRRVRSAYERGILEMSREERRRRSN